MSKQQPPSFRHLATFVGMLRGKSHDDQKEILAIAAEILAIAATRLYLVYKTYPYSPLLYPPFFRGP